MKRFSKRRWILVLAAFVLGATVLCCLPYPGNPGTRWHFGIEHRVRGINSYAGQPPGPFSIRREYLVLQPFGCIIWEHTTSTGNIPPGTRLHDRIYNPPYDPYAKPVVGEGMTLTFPRYKGEKRHGALGYFKQMPDRTYHPYVLKPHEKPPPGEPLFSVRFQDISKFH